MELTANDYWGEQLLERKLTFETSAEDGETSPIQVVLTGRQPNYVDIDAVLSIDRKPRYRAERAAAWLRPQSSVEQETNGRSIFGLWSGGGVWDVGARWSRMGLPGSDVERIDGQYVVRREKPGVYEPKPDARVAWTFYFSAMPKWLSSEPNRPDWQKWPPTDWEEYGKFVEFIARGAYQGGVKHFEVWNEPVPYASWMGSIESVVKLHEVTYAAIKRIATDTVVLGPCPYSFEWDFLEEFFELEGSKYIDDVLIHAYGEDPDLKFVDNLRRLRSMMDKHGLKENAIWITEKGYSTPPYTEREQARNLVKSYIYALSEDIRLLTWHMQWDYSGEEGSVYSAFAILRHDNTPRPAYSAFNTMTGVLTGAEFVAPMSGLTESQRGFTFRNENEVVRVLWSAGETSVLSVESSASTARLIDILGAEKSLVPKSNGAYEVELNGDPLYMVTIEHQSEKLPAPESLKISSQNN
ncbi:hypothetical protein [Thiorhodovibrio litoralis]|uniref:hypothetical protein n=1 Tax=Thiorhodovibrio litoralis TaxID=2952932 RepID=UPI002B264252|nr:hypothetical protein [Thiorhodovibrio litoralis]WPL11552.1 Beta-xylosidase [Thiorhodovibrio litoralis]